MFGSTARSVTAGSVTLPEEPARGPALLLVTGIVGKAAVPETKPSTA